MLVKNLTPFLVGTKVASRKPPEPDLVVVVRGRFALRKNEVVAADPQHDQGALSDEWFGEDGEDRQGMVAYPGDFADYKVGAEVLLMGKCHSPGGRPVTECPVVLRVGAFQKALRVAGDRTFTDKLFGPGTTAPEPFTEMPLSWSRAYGGPEYEKNPLGTGHRSKQAPNVLHPGDLADTRQDGLVPASFGPVPSVWAERVRRRGKEYGARWQATRAPFYAEDTDPRAFHSAPPDQWLDRPLAGDEEVFLQNLHPEHGLFATRLPALKIRVFCRLKKGDFVEAKANLDTLLVEPEDGVLRLTWRAHVPIRTLDLSDVASLLVASEPLAGPTLEIASYEAQLAEYEADPVGLKQRWPAGFADALDRYQRELRGEQPLPDPGAEGLDPVTALLRRKLGGLIARDEKRIAAAMAEIAAAAGDKIDLGAEAAKLDQRIADAPPGPGVRKPGAMPNIGLRRRMRALLDGVAETRKGLAAESLPADKRRVIEERLSELEQVPHDPRWKQLDPWYTPPIEPLTTHAPGPGLDLRDRDFTGADLSGKDLSGANFEGAVLTRANLSGANLSGANLRNALLFRADLEGANLSGADLTRVNAAFLQAPRAVFENANLEQASFESARLTGAAFPGAGGEFASFARSDLSETRFDGAELAFLELSDTTLDGASFRGAGLPSARFADAHGERVTLEAARVPRASFQRARLPGAACADLAGEGVIFSDAVLDGADLSFAVLHALFADDASFAGARLYGADLRRARMCRARLDRADLQGANLFLADLSYALVDHTRFVNASLYGAVLTGAAGKGADLLGANLKRSTLEKA